MLTLGSLFDGIGGWLLAAKHNGVKPIWSSEIERFPLAVTKHHFPDVIQMGDITKLDGATLPPVDIICAGSPCQDLSIANAKNRKGLDGERSGLFAESIRIVRQMRNATREVYPRFFVWENVPGALSSNSGMDFCNVLEFITDSSIPVPKSGGWASAGMVRSRRCDVGWRIIDAQYWGVPQRRRRIFLIADFGSVYERRPEVLFERKNVQGDIGSGKTKEQRPSGTVNRNVKKTSGIKETVYDISQRRDVVSPYDDGIVNTLNSFMGTGGNNVPVIIDKSWCIQGNTIDRQLQNGANGKGLLEELSYTLNTIDRHAIANGKAVRRLTPLECERLQGLPDNYTLIDDRSCSDSARYKALGNGMAQPCADFVIRRIKEATCDT